MKMALAVSLRRALLMLLSLTVVVLMVLYWNQGVIKPQSIIGNFERQVRSNREDANPYHMPAEKMWTYRCEGDKCVRHHYLGGGGDGSANGAGDRDGGRVPFLTCSMTCGEVNIWPQPTLSHAISSRSLLFSVEAVHLKMDTPYKEVQTLFRSAYDLFLKDLKRLQRIQPAAEGREAASEERYAQESRQRRSDPHPQSGEGVRGDASQGGKLAAAFVLANAFGGATPCPKCELDEISVNVAVHKSAETHLNFETDESYRLTWKTEKRHLEVHIVANSFFGARHGLSTLEQLMWFDDEANLLRILMKGQVRDAPKFRYRGLMLDTSRHFFSVESIKRTIVGMAHSKLNRFHWHITDSQSFPYVSKYYPELAAHGAYSDQETYTDADVREVTEFARIHGVQVLPEIDAPAHSGNGWDWGPKRGLGELSLCINQQPWSFFCGEPPCGQLNPKNNNTYLILQRLYEELLSQTGPTDYFHLGGDEVNLECWGQHFNDTDLRGLWCEFMQNAMARLKIANNNVQPKYVTVWSSGLTNTKCLPKEQFAVQVWGGSTWQENYDLIDNGFNVIFSHVDAWYLDCGFGSWRSTGEGACSPYRTWQNVYKHRPWERMRLDKLRRRQVLGGEVCLWTEQVDENQLDNRLWPRSAALGERLWSDPDEHDIDMLSQDVFKRMSVFRNRLVELGIKAEPIFPKYCAQNPGECI